jgi:hypothetical protein
MKFPGEPTFLEACGAGRFDIGFRPWSYIANTDNGHDPAVQVLISLTEEISTVFHNDEVFVRSQVWSPTAYLNCLSTLRDLPP